MDERPSQMTLRITGKGAKSIFENEVGWHRFQRSSPTDKKGMTHSSTITVACLDVARVIEGRMYLGVGVVTDQLYAGDGACGFTVAGIGDMTTGVA